MERSHEHHVCWLMVLGSISLNMGTQYGMNDLGREDNFMRDAVLLMGGHNEFSCSLLLQILCPLNSLKLDPFSCNREQNLPLPYSARVVRLCIVLCMYTLALYSMFVRAEACYSLINWSQIRYYSLAMLIFTQKSSEEGVSVYLYNC